MVWTCDETERCGRARRGYGDGMIGTGQRARPKKVWMKNIEEDLCELSLTQDLAYDRDRWSAIIKRQTR